MRLTKTFSAGSKVSFQFTLDDDDLYHCKMKSRHQSEGVPISKGSETHISSHDNYILSSSNHYHYFTLTRGKSTLLKLKFDLIDDKKKAPKKIKAKWTPDDGTPHFVLVSKAPDFDEETGIWSLDFGGRYAAPSVKNAILVDPETQEVEAMFRRVDPWEMHVDARAKMPPLFLFAVLVCLNICTF